MASSLGRVQSDNFSAREGASIHRLPGALRVTGAERIDDHYARLLGLTTQVGIYRGVWRGARERLEQVAGDDEASRIERRAIEASIDHWEEKVNESLLEVTTLGEEVVLVASSPVARASTWWLHALASDENVGANLEEGRSEFRRLAREEIQSDL